MMTSDATQRGVPWTVRDMIKACLACLVLFGFGVGVLVVVMLLWGEPPGAGISRVQALAVFSLEALLIIPAWVWGPGKHGGGWRALGLRHRLTAQMLGTTFLALIAVLVVNGLWEVARQALDLAGQPEILPFFGGGAPGLAVALVLGGVVAPVAEEVLFRGYLLPGLSTRYGRTWGILLSAAIFSAVHVFPGVLLPIFIMGLIFAWLYYRYDSLWPCIILHGLVNSLAFLVAFAAESLPSFLGP